MFIGGVMISATAVGQDSPKTYTLFEGANVSIGQGNQVYPVRDVSGGSWVIGVNGQEVAVSAKDGPISMKISPSLKLTEVSATISGLKGERAYTYENDPSVKLTRAMNQSASLNVSNHTAVNQATAVQSGAISATSMGINTHDATGTYGVGNRDPGLQKVLSVAQASVDSAANSAGADLFFKAAGDDSGDCDALDVSFEVSAGTQLSQPYIVVITRFHEKGADAGTSRNLVYAKALGPIDAKATKVQFEQAGFPPGFEPKGLEIHLYDHGTEVGTNIAQKRQMLSSDEAFEYVKGKYLAAHKDQTLPAVPVMGKLPEDLHTQIAEGKYAGIIYVRVTKEGLANEAFVDAACSQRIADPYLESVVRSIRFKPALALGAPVEGVASLNLSKLRI
jgi:hypothetical protein